MSWGGAIGLPALEQWSNTVRFRTQDEIIGTGSAVLDHDALQRIATASIVVLGAWLNDGSAGIGADAALNYVKVNWVNDQGLQPDQDTVVAEAVPERRSTTYPNSESSWINSYCLTLRTARARGRAHAGRIYPPCPVFTPGPKQPYIGLSNATGMATAFARVLYTLQELFDSETSDSAGDTKAGVFSPGDTFGKAALWEPITGVVCDRVVDVMHSRNRQVPRAEGALVAPGP